MVASKTISLTTSPASNAKKPFQIVNHVINLLPMLDVPNANHLSS
jgi:hypothetical protein